MDRHLQSKTKQNNNTYGRGFQPSLQNTSDRLSIGNVNRPQNNIHGVPVSLSTNIQHKFTFDHNHRYIKKKQIEQEVQRGRAKIRGAKKSKKGKSTSEQQGSLGKINHFDSLSNCPDLKKKMQMEKGNKIDEEYYTNKKKCQYGKLHNRLYEQETRPTKSASPKTHSQKIKVIRNRKTFKKEEDEPTQKLRLDSMKGVISFEGKLIKINPQPSNENNTVKKNEKSSQYFSEYLSDQFAAPYKKRISNSKQKRKSKSGQKNQKHPSSQKAIKGIKQSKSKSKSKSRGKKKTKRNTDGQYVQPFELSTNQTKEQNKKSKTIKIKQFTQSKPNYLAHIKEESLKLDKTQFKGSPLKKQTISISQLRQEILDEEQKSYMSVIANYGKNIYEQKVVRTERSPQNRKQASVNFTDYDCRARTINMMSMIAGQLAYKQVVFALSVWLFDYYCALQSKYKIVGQQTKQGTIIGSSNNYKARSVDRTKIIGITCLVLALKLQNAEIGQQFITQLFIILNKQKQQKSYELLLQQEVVSKQQHNLNREESGKHSSNRKVSKSKSKNGKNKTVSRKAQIERKKRVIEQRKRQILQLKFQILSKILNNQIQDHVDFKEVVEMETRIYWKVDKKIYIKTYSYWCDVLTSSWDQYIGGLMNLELQQLNDTFPNMNITNSLSDNLLFRNQKTPQKIWQLQQILESCQYFPQQLYNFNSAFIVLSIMYMLIRITLQSQQIFHKKMTKEDSKGEQILKIFEHYRKMLMKSSNILFVDTVNANLLFGEYLMKLKLEMGDILGCCQFVSQCFYPSPLFFNRKDYEQSFVSYEHHYLVYEEDQSDHNRQWYNHYDQRLSYHTYNPQLYIFFGRASR